MKMVSIGIKKLHHAAQLPKFGTPGAAGADCFACLDGGEPVFIPPGGVKLIPFGWACEIPEGFEMQVRPRSGLALKQGITVLNSPGTVDSDYRGPVGAVLINHSDRTFQVNHGDRIAQIVIAFVPSTQYVWLDSLTETQRGAGGYGSTGV